MYEYSGQIYPTVKTRHWPHS